MIYCLMTSKYSLTDEQRTELFNISVEMAKYGDKKRKRKLISVKTKYELAYLGGIAGFIFEAEIVGEKGINVVKYIVQTSDLEDIERAKWYKVKFADKRKSLYDAKPSNN